MSVIEIAPVRRDSSKLVIALAGQTGEGKTFTALELALGLADMNPQKVGMLDTEGRASLNESIYKGRVKGDHRFLNAVLNPPHSSERYALALQEYAAHGIEVVVVDSGSHEDEGIGGMQDYADRPKANGERRKMKDWIGAKRLHRLHFMSTLLFMPCHVIVCLRARIKFDFKNPDKPVSLGIQPVCERDFMYEMTASFLMKSKGLIHEEIKLPDELRPMLGNDGYFTAEHGRQLRQWVGGIDPVENARNVLRLAACGGSERLKEAWMQIGKAERQELATFKDTLKDAATHADTERLAIKGDSGAPGNEPEHEWEGK